MIAKISEKFLAEAFNMGTLGPWLIGLLVVIGFLLLLTIFLSFRARKNKYFPYGCIIDPKQIHKVLRSAFDQRRPFELQIKSSEATRRPTFRCSPEYVGNSTITLEINGIKKLSDRWLNREIQVFFRLRLDGNFTYFTFDSIIESISTPRKDICHITISIPSMLDNRQKRSFLRLTPSPDLILGAALWHGSSMPEGAKVNNIALWKLPQLLYLPNKSIDFELLDLSAGGMRISIPRAVAKEKNLEFSSVEHVIILLDLMDPEQSKRVRCWVQCRIQNVWEEHITKQLHLGLQFLSWARPRDITNSHNSSELEWLRLSSSMEVEVIGNWIMRRHLELYREMPSHHETDNN